jgi:cellulose synthase/poly-beta-1,6-N-acetylglucosamine synthase-like glycosyltransferase
VLNIGFTYCSHDIVAVYDADNQPQRDSLKLLIPHLLRDDSLAAVVGKFRTVNRKKNWLTKFINIETLAFQWILQAGRFFTSGVTILPGTNYVIRKQVLRDIGGWDVSAITEDAELSVRIYEAGYRIKFMPLSVTWEQEPEKLSVWMRQRMRWIRGNNYVLKKFAQNTLKPGSRFLFTEFLYLFALYYLFLAAIVLSHVLLLLSVTGLVALSIPGPYFGVWVSAYVLFVIEIAIVLSYEKEDSLRNLCYTACMYFTYCQLWLFIVIKSMATDIWRHRVGIWDKTDRFHIVESIKIEEEIL